MKAELNLILLFVSITSITVLIYKYLTLEYPIWFYMIGYIYRLRHSIGSAHAVQWDFTKRDTAVVAHRSPNIILILADDLGVNDISGNNGVSTPHIDSLFQNGVKFNNAYAGHATCAPSRASIFTGRFATRFGYEYTPVPAIFSELLAKSENTYKGRSSVRYGTFHRDRKSQVPAMGDMVVPLSETFVADKLKLKGYDTAYIGKWHLGESKGYRPQDRGFDKFLGMLQGASLFMPVDEENLVNAELKGEPTDDFIRYNAIFAVDDHNGNKFKPDEYLTDYLAREASNAISAQSNINKETPFFIAVSFNAPHTPLQALRSDYEDPEISKISDHKQRVYAAMIKSLDRGVGKILEAVKASGQEDNTMIIFTSDNGGATYTGLKNINYPYRGGKATFFEGGLRIPMLMKWPAMISSPSGIECNSTVSHLDIFATIAHATNMEISPDKQLDGFNLIPLLSQNTGNKYLESKNNKTADLVIDMEFLKRINLNLQSVTSNSPLDSNKQINDRVLYWRSGYYKSVRMSNWKLKISENPNKIWFYDLHTDPTEQVNLAANISPNDIDLISSDSDSLLNSNDFDNENCLFNSTISRYDNNINSLVIEQCHSVVINKISSKDTIIPIALCSAISELMRMDRNEMKQSLWPSLSESPLSIDNYDVLSLDEEYIYWPN